MKDGAMNLADELAVQRTTLANERTWLAYLRTALTLFVAGVTFVQFFSSRIIQLIGWGFIPLGMVTALVGWTRYRQARRLTKQLHRNARS